MRRRPLVLALALLAAAAPAAAQGSAFRARGAVVQINDVYRIDAVGNGTAGGLGRVASLVQQTRRQTGLPVAIFHAGDFIAPSLESRYFAGQQMVDALNFLQRRAPLLLVPGNHEFDSGQAAMLAGAVRESRFSWLGSNLSLATGDAAVDGRIRRDTVIDLGGMKVGVFAIGFLDVPRGYASADTAFVEVAERSIRRLEEQGVDAIVGLTHLELRVDRRIALLHRTHPKLLWIAGGHEHFLIHDAATDSSALLTKGDANARRVWRVLLGEQNGEPAVQAQAVTLDSTVAIDPEYQSAVAARWAAEMRKRIPLFDQQIGTSSVTLVASESAVRGAESNWGNYLTDLMRTAFPDVPADIAVLNGGAIRIDDEFAGSIRWEHIARTFGFPTRVGLVWLRGRDVRETILERSVSGAAGEGYFLQVSGVRFTFDRSLPTGARVTSVQTRSGSGWAPLEETRVYVVAVPDFIYGGGDDYHFKDRALMTVPPGPDLRLMLFDALLAGYSQGQAIAPAVEGRINEILH